MTDVCSDPPLNLCDVPCATDDACGIVSSSLRCVSGFCRDATAATSTDAGNDANAATECARGQVAPSEVLFLGDTLFATSHQIPADVEDLARQAGSLGASEVYRDNSTTNANFLALHTPGIADQYVKGQNESPVKVVVMDGGGADVLEGTCPDPPTSSCQTLVNAAAAARQLLSQMAQDSVQHVVYVFYPNPVDTTLQAMMDVLRPLIQSACATSPVPCHWIDLRPIFADHYSDYVLSDGRNPTNAGSAAVATAIWDTMRQNCIAQ